MLKANPNHLIPFTMYALVLVDYTVVDCYIVKSLVQ